MGQSAAKINEQLSVDHSGMKRRQVTARPREATEGGDGLEMHTEVTSFSSHQAALINTDLAS